MISATETTSQQADAIVAEPERVSVLRNLKLLDTETEEAFDRLTRLASQITGSAVSLVALIDADRSFFKSTFGLPDALKEVRSVPLSHSFCKHVVADNKPLILQNAAEDPILKDNSAYTEMGATGYLGMPLTTTDGVGLGSFCVIDMQPREWSEKDIDIIRELTLSTMTEIELRAQIEKRKQAEEDLQQRNRAYRRVYKLADSTLRHTQGAIDRGAELQEIKVYLNDMKAKLASLPHS